MNYNKNKSILSKIKTYKPDVMLIDFHGTLVSVKWEDEVILPFVLDNLDDFFFKNWNDVDFMILIDELREQSFFQRFRFNQENSPLIEEEPEEQVRKSVSNFIKWQISNKKETETCLKIQRMIWEEGFKQKKIFTIIFDDVFKAFQLWKNNYIKIFIISGVNKNEIILFLKHTSHGDLTSYITEYFDNEVGSRLKNQTYLDIAKRALCPTNRITFLTHSGKKAKVASESGLECILVKRPGNLKIREYYLTLFTFINSFDELEFVKRM